MPVRDTAQGEGEQAASFGRAGSHRTWGPADSSTLLKVSQQSQCVRRLKCHRKEAVDLLLFNTFNTVCGFLSLRSSILVDQKKFEQCLCVFLVFSSHVSCFFKLVATAMVILHLSSSCSKWKRQTCF